jgi:hypothetical protein
MKENPMSKNYTFWHVSIGTASLFSLVALLMLPLGDIQAGGRVDSFTCIQLCGKLADVLSRQRNPLLALMVFLLVLGMAVLAFAFLLAFLSPAREKGRDLCAIAAPFLILLPLTAMVLENQQLFSAIGYGEDAVSEKTLSIWFFILIGLLLALLILGILDLFSDRVSGKSDADTEKTILWQPSPIPEPVEEKPVLSGGYLLGRAGMQKGKRFPIQPGQIITIGRSPACDIPITTGNRFISRKHCTVRLSAKTGKYAVTDYSRNGVYIKNETPDLRDARLPSGTAVHLGRGATICLGLDGNEFYLG